MPTFTCTGKKVIPPFSLAMPVIKKKKPEMIANCGVGVGVCGVLFCLFVFKEFSNSFISCL